MIGPQFPSLSRLVEAQLDAFPQHAPYLKRRFADDSGEQLAFADELAQLITKVIGNRLADYLGDYRWLTDVILEEEIVFRRTGAYRLSTFAEAEREIYANREYMARYMNGVLLSQLWWRNHTEVMHYFRDVYLAGNANGASHLEIGPGHGLFLCYAAMSPHVDRVSGWDVSATSIEQVRHAFRSVGLKKPVTLELTNMLDAPAGQFDSVTFSEVLEHLEQPRPALDAIFRLLKPAGCAFINAPVNSPAPDHLTLFRTPEEIVDLIRDTGFEIEDSLFSPTTGATLARARKLGLTISTAVIARKPGNPNAG